MTAGFDNGVLSALRLEMVLRFVKCDPRSLLDMTQEFFRKIDVSIQPCAHCCAAKGNLSQDFNRFLCAFLRVSNLLCVTGKLLPEPNRRCVHQVCPADLDDVPEFFRL